MNQAATGLEQAEMERFSSNRQTFDFRKFEDISVHLNRLLLNGNRINEEFHELMEHMVRRMKSELEIDGMEYRDGPVKLLERCREKVRLRIDLQSTALIEGKHSFRLTRRYFASCSEILRR